MKRISCLAPVSFTREESQIPLARSSTSLARKWSSVSAPNHRCKPSAFPVIEDKFSFLNKIEKTFEYV